MREKKKIIEASMCLGFFRATHVLSFGSRKIYDTGIDSQQVTWRPADFVKMYQKHQWVIDQIV